MKNYLLLFAFFLVSVNAYAQHSIQLDDGIGDFSIITASSITGTYLLPNGGGTLLTSINNIPTIFPAAQGGANTFLKNDGSGNLSWSLTPGATTSFSLTSQSGNYTIANTDQVVQGDISAGSFTFTLPPANTFAAGQTLILKAVSPGNPGTGNTITLATTGGELVDDAAIAGFFGNNMTEGQAVHLYSDGVANWYSW